jgi:tRNA (adenine57-N1/adenine58-N1)-methyltransferase
MYLSFVPTVPQVVQTVEALERETVFGMVETFETLLRTWSIQGRSVRPDHRMVAHSGFITVARKIESGLWPGLHIVEAVAEAADSHEEREDCAR